MNKPNIHHFSMNNELFRSSDADASDAMNNSCIHRKNDEYSVIIFEMICQTQEHVTLTVRSVSLDRTKATNGDL